MPSLTMSPSSRTIFTVIRPSITMLSPSLRERTSISSWFAGSGHRERMLEGVLRRIKRDHLFANQGVAVDDDGAFQIDGGLAVRPEGDDVQNHRIGGIMQT